MTDITDFGFESAKAAGLPAHLRNPQWKETYWGLSVRDVQEISGWTVGAQLVSFAFGAGCLVAAFGLWAAVDEAISEQFVLRAMMSGFLLIGSYMLLSFANQGGQRELEFDHNLGEIRAVALQRNGTRKLIGQFGIDAFDSLTITQHNDNTASLVLGRMDGSNGLLVTKGDPARVAALYLRLDRDMLRTTMKRTHHAIDPIDH